MLLSNEPPRTAVPEGGQAAQLCPPVSRLPVIYLIEFLVQATAQGHPYGYPTLLSSCRPSRPALPRHGLDAKGDKDRGNLMEQLVLRDSAQALPPPRAFPGAQRSPHCHPTARLWNPAVPDWNLSPASDLLCDFEQMNSLSVLWLRRL